MNLEKYREVVAKEVKLIRGCYEPLPMWEDLDCETLTELLTDADQILLALQPAIEEARKSGVKKVADWLDAHNNDMKLPLEEGASFHIYLPEEWQSKKKEWGISPSGIEEK